MSSHATSSRGIRGVYDGEFSIVRLGTFLSRRVGKIDRWPHFPIEYIQDLRYIIVINTARGATPRETTMTIPATGYMIQDKQGNAIFGIGETVDEAWAQVVDDAGPFFDINGDEKPADVAFAEDFRVYGATVALMQKVRDHGGAITWDVVGGVACTVEENEEA